MDQRNAVEKGTGSKLQEVVLQEVAHNLEIKQVDT